MRTTESIAQADRLEHALEVVQAWGRRFPVSSWGYFVAARHESEIRADAIKGVRQAERFDRTEQRKGVW